MLDTTKEKESEEEKLLTDNIPDHLHPNVKKYWFITDFTALTLLIFFFGTPFLIGAALFEDIFWVAAIAITMVILIGMCAFLAMIQVKLIYKNTTFLVKEDSLTISKGILFKQSSTLPFSRVQNISISSGPFERMYGLSTLAISTAGWGGSRIQGIGNPELLRDIILKRVAITKNNGL